jgi:hypothetical protein
MSDETKRAAREAIERIETTESSAPAELRDLPGTSETSAPEIRGGGINRIVVTDGTIVAKVK